MMRNKIILLVCVCLLTGCAAYHVLDGIDQPVRLYNSTIYENTLWRGDIIVNGIVTVPAGVTLKIASGSRVLFTNDTDDKKSKKSGLYVNGQILALGKKDKPIIFTSALTSPVASSWGEIEVEYSPYSKFEFCRFKYADWGLHLHFSAVEVDNCTFENSTGGLRFRSGPISITHNIIKNNKIGMRFIYSQPIVKYNDISGNLTGIFIREGARHPDISYNNLNNRHYNIQLGEAQEYDITCPHNWWGSTDIKIIEKYLFDKQDADYIGRIFYDPIAKGKYLSF